MFQSGIDDGRLDEQSADWQQNRPSPVRSAKRYERSASPVTLTAERLRVRRLLWIGESL